MNIQAGIEEYLASKQNSITKDTYSWYNTFLTKFERYYKESNLTDLTQISIPHVQKFVASNPKDSEKTRHHKAQIVKGFLNWCSQDEDMGVREKMVRRIEMPKVVQPEIEIFTELDINNLLRACEKTNHPHRNKAIIHMLLNTGARISELFYDGDRPEEETGLRIEHLTLGRGSESFIYVMGKRRKTRTIGIGQETSLAVRRYLNRERRRDGCAYVFVGRDGEPFSVRMIQQLLDALGEAAHVENCHAYRFRHTFAVTQLLNGTSDLILMRLMGHSTLESTKIYTRAMSQVQARKAAPSVVDIMQHPSRP
ncbi:MAG TPA: tyrosine-type recombinase/integrase [Ktedonobacteraceae bacterium]|nr:tyrosine-type recombinase/integrase [Ktedonobacteraceae bacterium]